MNEVFLMGKVITDIDFNFVINSKNNSIVEFELETIKRKHLIKCIAYNEIADFVYRKVKLQDIVFVYGKVSNKGILIENIVL